MKKSSSTSYPTTEYVPETYNSQESIKGDNKNITLQIKEEQLDIVKRLVKTGEANIYKEILTEEKNFTIPVTYEELVIEKKSFTSDTSSNKDASTEIIRIRLNEEQVEFTKHKVALEDVSIYKDKIDDVKHIEETLMKEKAKVKISGSPRVIDESRMR